jgi:hypothetical protein
MKVARNRGLVVASSIGWNAPTKLRSSVRVQPGHDGIGVRGEHARAGHSIEVYPVALRVDGIAPGVYHYEPRRHNTRLA